MEPDKKPWGGVPSGCLVLLGRTWPYSACLGDPYGQSSSLALGATRMTRVVAQNTKATPDFFWRMK